MALEQLSSNCNGHGRRGMRLGLSATGAQARRRGGRGRGRARQPPVHIARPGGLGRIPAVPSAPKCRVSSSALPVPSATRAAKRCGAPLTCHPSSHAVARWARRPAARWDCGIACSTMVLRWVASLREAGGMDTTPFDFLAGTPLWTIDLCVDRQKCSSHVSPALQLSWRTQLFTAAPRCPAAAQRRGVPTPRRARWLPAPHPRKLPAPHAGCLQPSLCRSLHSGVHRAPKPFGTPDPVAAYVLPCL